MSYHKWSDCPPRAPLGRADALYGSHDHLVLLLGRIADFTVRDRKRKIRQNDADGGWKPRPGMPGFGPPPSMNNGHTSQPTTPTTPMGPPPHMQAPPPGWSGLQSSAWKGPPPSGFRSSQSAPSNGLETPGQSPPSGPPSASMPTFYGMAPAKSPAPLTAGYNNSSHDDGLSTPNSPLCESIDLTAAYDIALTEWSNLTAAHATVAHVLASTDSFASLPDDLCPPPPGGQRDSKKIPFGPALTHRSYHISIIWTLLHMAKIILLRCHPAMPPAMHMAAGVCAQATQPYAMLIGRIIAGMQIPLGDDLSPSLGAVLVESTMPLFFAGIQFQDAKQRAWLITRLIEIDRRSGWASAGVIARGCESAWEKAACMGRGPSYVRRTRRFGEKGSLVLDEDAQNDRGHNQQYVYAGRQGTQGNTGGHENSARNVEGIEEMRYVVARRPPPWAMNLLGTEEDLRASMERVGF